MTIQMYEIGPPQGPCIRCGDMGESRHVLENDTQRITVALCNTCKWLSTEDLFGQLGGINHGTNTARNS